MDDDDGAEQDIEVSGRLTITFDFEEKLVEAKAEKRIEREPKAEKDTVKT